MKQGKELGATDEQIDQATDEWFEDGMEKDLITCIIDRVILDEIIKLAKEKGIPHNGC